MCFICNEPEGTEEQEASNEMDGLMAIALQAQKEYAEKSGLGDSAVDRSALADVIASNLMYKCQPATIARTLAVMMGRYAHLLAVFGDRYAADPQSEFIDELPYLEWQRAATRAVKILNEQDLRNKL